MADVRRTQCMAGRYRDRAEAGRQLAALLLEREALEDCVVVGIGQGGFAVAVEVGRALGAPVEMMTVEELDLGDPVHPPTCLGAVSSAGRLVVRLGGLDRLALRPGALHAAISRARARMAPSSPEVEERPRAARSVVAVDDGTSSQGTLLAVADMLRHGDVEKVVLAVAMAPGETEEQLHPAFGDVVVARTPTWMEWLQMGGRLYEQDLQSRPPAAAPVGARRPPAG